MDDVKLPAERHALAILHRSHLQVAVCFTCRHRFFTSAHNSCRAAELLTDARKRIAWPSRFESHRLSSRLPRERLPPPPCGRPPAPSPRRTSPGGRPRSTAHPPPAGSAQPTQCHMREDQAGSTCMWWTHSERSTAVKSSIQDTTFASPARQCMSLRQLPSRPSSHSFYCIVHRLQL